MIDVGKVVGRRSEAFIAIDSSSMLQFKPDGIIVTSQCGFAPLGNMLNEMKDQKVANLLSSLSDEIYERSRDRILIKMVEITWEFPRWVIMTPTTECSYYWDRCSSFRNDIWIDYIYNLTYISLELAYDKPIRTLAITHLTNTGFSDTCALAMAEAIGHFYDNKDTRINRIVFCGCCVTEEGLRSFSRLNPEGSETRHRDIKLDRKELSSGIEVEFKIERYL